MIVTFIEVLVPPQLGSSNYLLYSSVESIKNIVVLKVLKHNHALLDWTVKDFDCTNVIFQKL